MLKSNQLKIFVLLFSGCFSVCAFDAVEAEKPALEATVADAVDAADQDPVFCAQHSACLDEDAELAAEDAEFEDLDFMVDQMKAEDFPEIAPQAWWKQTLISIGASLYMQCRELHKWIYGTK